MRASILDREEYIEQAYFFRVYRERLQENIPSQEILHLIQEEILATTRLPMAIDFLRTEIMHSGRISDAMVRLPHYFAPFQTFVMQRAEDDESRFEQLVALKILENEAAYRARNPTRSGMFVYQFECIARNRLGYTDGLKAMALDPLYNDEWTRWIGALTDRLGGQELSELIYRASQHFYNRRKSRDAAHAEENTGDVARNTTTLFGDQEGRIAKANIGRDPLFFFAALQRQLDYPAVPRPQRADEIQKLPAYLEARLVKIEQRLKIVEMESKGGIDLKQFYKLPDDQSNP
ncbi:MAG: hypothetical protein KDB01_08325 [Planctomycetaceae bacterium]|nr:hypothetical protein [Planctomycetaceae bacterium]